MAKKSTKKKTAPPAARKRAATGTTSPSANLRRLLDQRALDPDAARALSAVARAKIDSLTADEVDALVSAHSKVSPRRRWRPDPDGSIF